MTALPSAARGSPLLDEGGLSAPPALPALPLAALGAAGSWAGSVLDERAGPAPLMAVPAEPVEADPVAVDEERGW